MTKQQKSEQKVDAMQVYDNAIAPRMVLDVEAMKQIHADKQQFIREVMVIDHDYGTIPGCGSKPTLLKPGAEKLLQVYGYGSLMDRVAEHTSDNGVYEITYKCSIINKGNGQVIAQCEGSANSTEKKNWSMNPMKLKNTIQKIAQKRAFVGATLFATGCSDVFTQDIEDMGEVISVEAFPIDDKPLATSKPAMSKEAIDLQNWIIGEVEAHAIPKDAVKKIIFDTTGDPKMKLRNIDSVFQLEIIQNDIRNLTKEEAKGA